MPQDLIRMVEAAELLGVTKQYISKLVKDGKVKTYTVAKLLSEKEIRQFIANSRKRIDKVNQV